MKCAVAEARTRRRRTPAPTPPPPRPRPRNRWALARTCEGRAAGRFDAGDRASRQDAAATRLFVASAAREVVEGAVRFSGPLALTDDRLMARAHRDVLFFSETGGGVEALRPVIAASLPGRG
ncbi:acyl-CoA dehydrogenase family protein [Nocardiopsis sp. N85]|uniref:acyl-CoA dehydrogenase family protein n=1 Tax=Nocardiopsis sp. N85 TaxID=3029400 RepID=UPI00237FB5A3|nr:acyl-CoA dehydrogenase family protein [Nocardiopsis sp. N85]MDE3722552.1 acyl-CoA dehydrogenase family protein [Nocardiopsis sp. N85]